ncbi:MAG: glycosyltransferase family 9 protein [Fimbriimonadaceae bacterium]|nr:glycosyltransferase family 9 protein [Fimbriimonadaceae bacterium]
MSSPPKVLVVRFAAIGDCVITAFAVTAIRKQWPDARIVWAVQREPSVVIACPELVQRHAIFDRKVWKKSRWNPATWRAQTRAWLDLRRENFDLGFDFQGHSKTALALRIAAPKERYAARATDALAARLTQPVALKQIHQVERDLEFVSLAGVHQSVERPIMPDLEAEVTAFRQQIKAPSLVTITTGAGWPDKVYPTKHWEEVARRLVAAGHHVMTLGAPGEPELQVDGIDNRVGKLTLRQAMVALAASKVHLGADTGNGHIAAAYGVPVVTLFSKHGPEQFLPRGSRALWLRAQPVQDIPVHAVLEKADELLGGQN